MLARDDFYGYVSQKYEFTITKDETDDCKNRTCGDPSYYKYNDISWYPEEVTKGFLTNDDKEIEKSKIALIEQIAYYSNYTLTMQELEICVDVSLSF